MLVNVDIIINLIILEINLTTRFCELGRSGKIVHKTWLVHKIGN